MTLAEILKAANIKDEVIAGLPAEVTTALTGYVAEADTKLTTAAQAEANARETLRQAGLEKDEINEYVEKYGADLNSVASVRAQNESLLAYLKSLKEQGFDVKIPGDTAAPPKKEVTTVAFDPEKFAGQVGTVIAQVVDANNEHIRLTGQPLPDSMEVIAAEAQRSRKPVKQYVEEKYKFAEIRDTKSKADFQARIDSAVKTKMDEEKRKLAEKFGSNPNLRPGQSSRNSFIPKIKSEEFHKSDGNKPRRERLGNMLDKIHQEVAANQGA